MVEGPVTIVPPVRVTIQENLIVTYISNSYSCQPLTLLQRSRRPDHWFSLQGPKRHLIQCTSLTHSIANTKKYSCRVPEFRSHSLNFRHREFALHYFLIALVSQVTLKSLCSFNVLGCVMIDGEIIVNASTLPKGSLTSIVLAQTDCYSGTPIPRFLPYFVHSRES